MENKELLELCCKITGSFEASGTPDYTDLAGNADGQGLSAGILQWNAGQGTLQSLLIKIAEKMGWDKVQSYFKSDVHHLAVLRNADAVEFCVQHYLVDGTPNLAPAAIYAWKNLLGQPESIQAQIDLAESTVLNRAKILAKQFCPGFEARTRVLAFFFDLVTQSGGMRNAKGAVDPIAFEEIKKNGANDLPIAWLSDFYPVQMVKHWGSILGKDDVADWLFYYAYKRSLLSKEQYRKDALFRRGTIACRTGIVHGKAFDFTSILD
jgi:hypothetical protein